MKKEKLLKQTELEGKIKVNMSSKVYNQIKYLTWRINNVEWSGVMFYTIKGDIENKETFEINLEEVFLMDKGNYGSTEFSMDSSIVSFIMEKEERFNWKIGLIHSHNSMDVFFSVTDINELIENAPKHNFYFSLIVNNAMNFKAKIALYGKLENHSDVLKYKCKNSEGKDFTLSIKENGEDTVFTYDCDVVYENNLKVEDYFERRTEEIINKPIVNYHNYDKYYKNDDYYGWQDDYELETAKDYKREKSMIRKNNRYGS